MGTFMYLPDVNVWLALTFECHHHHAYAVRWMETIGSEKCAFCRYTQQGYLRLSTNPSAFGNEAVTMSRAWELYDILTNDDRILFAQEPIDTETLWRAYSDVQISSPNVWNDAYLAAFATAGGLLLATFDRTFNRFARLRYQILSAG